MNRPDPPFSPEMRELKARADRLAREKANLSLLADLMRKLSAASGLESVAENILHTLMGTIGGTNLTLCYRADGGFTILDSYGRKEKLPEIDDAAVREAFETCSFVEHGERTGQEAHSADLMKGRTWVFPLHVGSNCIGALKMEGVLILGAEMQPQIASFLKYSALVLNNEIHNYSQLQVALEKTREANLKLLAEIEERKQAEEALRKSEERHRTILQTAMDGIWLVDTRGRLVEVNETYCRMSGYGAQELLTMRISDLEAVESDDDIATRMQKIMVLGEDRFESRHRRKDGSVFDVEVSVQYRPADGGRCVVFLQNITERKRAKETLREERWRLRSIIESTRVGTWEWNVQTGEAVFNETWAEIVGYALDELSPLSIKTWEALAHPDDLKRSGELLERHFLGILPYYDFECRMKHKDGHWVWVQDRGRVITHTADGNPLMMFGTHTDITKRKQAEEALQKSHDMIVKLAVQVPGVLYQYRLYPDGRSSFPFASPGMNDIYEVTPEDVREDATPVFGRLHPDDHDRIVASIRESARTLQPFHCEFRVVLPRQGLRWRLSDALPERAEDGGTLWHGIISDITGRKRAEEEKEQLQDQLHQAMKMEAVGRLAGGVAHDFNNLLTVITGYSELLLRKVGKGLPMHGELAEIKKAGERAASLTQQLLAFSRKQIIEPKVVRLDRLVAEVQAMLTRLIGEDIALQTITGKALGAVKIDPGQFHQILMNLAVNARDAMPGGGKIVIETANAELDEGYCTQHPYLTPGRFVMLSVSDTGIGMSEEVKTHIFEPFFTTKERGSGTGLGLATTYGAVKQAGGSIEVQSEAGKGTAFRIYLPRVEETAAEREKDIRPRDLPGGTETVLLVEDEGSLRTLCARILGDLGYRVRQARNGAEAVEVAVGHGDRIDLLLTDVVMPGMSGKELATQLVLHHPEMKVLFMSGYTDDAIVHHGVLDEGVSFIGKPYSPERLGRKVREVLDKV